MADKKTFILISPKNRTVYNFRGDLIKDIQNKGYDVIVTGPNDDHLDKIHELGVRFVKIPLNKSGMSISADLKYLAALKKLFKKEKPDAVLGYTIKPVIYGAIAAKGAKVKNITSMVTGAGYLFSAKSFKAKLVKRIACLLYKKAFKAANRVIFQNPDDMKEFRDLNLLKEDKCHIVNGSGVNMEHFAPRPLPEKISFFMLSRVMFSKGIREYLAAAKSVKEHTPDVRFMLLGAVENMPDSLKKEELQPYIDSGIIDYFGETSDVRDYYEKASVFVLPSYREGTPRTVLEAMSMGRAIITTDAPGCRETVIDGQNGYIVPVEDSQTLSERMLSFINDPLKVEIMGKASNELCKEKFDVTKVNASMLSIMNIE